MKIIRPKEENFIKFEELDNYEFFVGMGGTICLKIPPFFDELLDEKFDAVDIERELPIYFESYDKVRLLNCDLVIHN